MPAQRGVRPRYLGSHASARTANPSSQHAAAHGGHRGHELAGHAWLRPPAGGELVSTYPDHILRVGSEHLAELKRKAAEFERQLWDAHESLEHEIEQTALFPEAPVDGLVPEVPVDGLGAEVPADGQQESFRWTAEVGTGGANEQTQLDVTQAAGDLDADAAYRATSPEERTARLIDHGRRPPEPTHRGRRIVLIGVAVAAGAALVVGM